MILMPRRSHRGPLPPLTGAEQERADRLQADVQVLAAEIGERTTRRPEQLARAAAFIHERFARLGYAVRDEAYQAGPVQVANIEAELVGTTRRDEIIVIGAHYDSAPGTPGANDNASGTAAVLELARHFRDAQPTRTVRFVAFTNEEPPFFHTELMGSTVYARGARERREKIVAMLSLECLGCYADRPGSQQYPPPFQRFYPDTADFIAFVGNVGSYGLLRRCIGRFRATTRFPSQGLVAPERVQFIGWSDQWSFWRYGYPAIMVTDTAIFRDRQYHLPGDTPEKLDYQRMARVVGGIGRVVEFLGR